MKIVYMGSPEFAVAPLERLIQDGHEIAGVFTQRDKPKNRGMKTAPTPVKKAALAHGIPVFQPASFKSEGALAILEGLEADIAVVTAYGMLLPQRALDAPRLGCVNVHASLLPDYRGASPIQQAILQGETKTGVTIMQMDAGLDTGDILLAKEIAIEPEETADSLHDKLAALGAEALSQCLKELEAGCAAPQPQPAECPHYAPRICREDGRIRFTETAEQIDRMARGLTPWPGTFSSLGGKTIKLFGLQAKSGGPEAPCGQILACDAAGLRVRCADGVVEIAQIQAPGGKRMNCVDYFRGHPEEREARFE